ncbi:serine/threonine-protein kinase 31 isoform 2-T2 [Clarias gariepinus]|uniref:serine/threonine kinase 31 isoform X2 n=1 Tax=Clarias gariepinus TaxID=13013 RepID=UPI00234CAE4A|nr:serine/threonine kinase 31 isoform X2 [Clarias gariepinus]
MEQSGDEAQFEAMELVLVTHVVDAITFWAQNVTEDKASEKMDTVLSEKCPTAQRVMGEPSPHKVYGACYSGDRCWYRCKVQKQINDTFHVAYIDYGNEEVVARSDLVELPGDLNSAALAKRYQFWGFHLASEPDSPHYFQGKSFLQNLIYGKKLRISMKSECFDGTILVQAFQGNLDIGEEVLKFKFATLNLPGNKSPVSPTMAFQKQTGLGPSRKSQGDCDSTDSLGCMPKLRPVSSNQKVFREQSTCKSPMAASVSGADGELVKENQQPNPEMVIQHLRSRVNEQMLNEAKLELQRAREEVEEKIKQIYKLEKENNDLQDHAEHLQQELKETRLELQKASEVHPGKDECVEVNMGSTVFERFFQLAEKAEEVRRNRESTRCNTAEERLSEAISVVINNKIVLPPLSETLEMAWEDYRHALKQLKECQSGELEELVNCKNQACSLLLTAIDDFLMVAGSLPISDRLNTLKDVSSTLMVVFGLVSVDDVQDQSLETFCEWKTQKQHSLRNMRQATDKSLCALSNWVANTSKFFCLTEMTGTTVTLEAVDAKVNELLKQAESDVSEELNTKFFEQNVEDMKIMSTACYIVMQLIQNEEHLLCDLRETYEYNKKFKEDIQWQNSLPKADELLQIKKHIKSLRAQLRWKLVEVGCLEEADDLDLPEIHRKKEEVSETRNALFQQIKQEKEQYTKLCKLVKGNFPELLLLYPEANISSYLLFEGLLMKSLDRDIFDAEPMRELSGRRPLVCTEFQYQKVVLKGYSVDEESEGMMIKQAAQYHRAQNQHPSSVMPLLGLFFGKSDPLAYIIVPYYSNGSLKALQKLSPLAPSEIGRVMRGVVVGLQSLHESCITHASLNANNVFVLGREQGIVGDFDFTKTPEQRAVDCGMVAGSISLVAPELRRGEPPSPASDMYAVGGLMLWLHAPDYTEDVDNEQHIPRLSGLQLDFKVQTLLSKLLVCSGRLSACEALCSDYFLSLEN